MPFIGGAIIGSALIGGAASGAAADKQAGAANAANQLADKQYTQTTNNLAPFLGAGTAGLDKLSYLLGLPGSEPGGRVINGATYQNIDQVRDIFRQDYINKLGGRGEVDEAALNAAVDKVWRGATPANQTPTDPAFGSLLKPFGLEDFQASPAYQFNLEEGRKALDKAAASRGRYYAPATLQDIAKFSQGLASNEFQNAFSNYNTSMGNIYSRLSNVAGAGQNAAVQQGGFGANYANNAGQNMIGAGNAQAAGLVGGANALTSGVGQYANNQFLNNLLARNQAPTYGGGGMVGDFNGLEGVFA